MYKLGALDAGFLYNETDSCPQHIASVQVLELPDGVSAQQFVEHFKALLLQRIHLVPYFTNRLQRVPFDLDHPVWVRDSSFDINNHVHSIEVAAPGGRAQMEQTVARLHEQRLDRAKPLWDLWVLTGLEGGRVATYNRVHHACLDGMAGQVMIQTIMDVTPQPRQVEPAPAGFLKTSQRPGAAALFAGALENFAQFQAKQPLAMVNAVETAARLFRRTFDPRKGFGALAAGAPRTRFNAAVQRKRVYATGEMDISSVKTVARISGSKINDVFLAAVSGGLRRYLSRSGQLPQQAMVAGCPVSLRLPGDQSTNNQVTMMMVDLATSEADPVAALQIIARSSLAAKGLTADLAAGFDAEVSLPGMPRTLQNAAALLDFTGLADLPAARMPCNLVVSNVPGPQQQLFCCGARVLTHYPVSIPAHGQAVNITVQSYAGQMFFAITACAKALPDADRLRDDIVNSFAQLMEEYGVVPEVTDSADEDSGVRPNGVPESEPENVAMQKIPGRNAAVRRDRNNGDTQTKAA